MSETIGGRRSGGLLRSKFASIADADKQKFPDSFSEDPLSSPWLAARMHPFIKERGLGYCAKKLNAEASASEIQKRHGCPRGTINLYTARTGDNAGFHAYSDERAMEKLWRVRAG